MPVINYPNVICNVSNTEEPGYMICNHVKSAKDVAHFESATEKELGMVCCKECREAVNLHDFKSVSWHFELCCAPCLRAAGIIGENASIH